MLKSSFGFILFITASSILLLSFSQKGKAYTSSAVYNDTIPDSTEVIFEKVEIEASVDRASWISHLTKNLTPVIEKAAKKRIKVGTYTVHIRFLVEKDGSIKDVKAMNDPGFGFAEGAIKVVRTGPKWSPGEINGKKVRSYHTQPISFVISEE